MFSLRAAVKKSRRCPCSSVGLRSRCTDLSRSRSIHRLPFNRMQLWIFPSQRDNEVSSGAQNETVVCPWVGVLEGGGGLWKQAEQGLCRRGASPESCEVTLFTCAKRLSIFSPETRYYLTVCRFLEKVVIGDCWKVSHHVNPHDLKSKAIISALKNKMKSVLSACWQIRLSLLSSLFTDTQSIFFSPSHICFSVF